MMLPDTQLTIRSTTLAASAQEGMSPTTKEFIGAVEDEWELYSDNATDYTIGAPIGFGASSIVYAATYYPCHSDSASRTLKRKSANGIPCALKVLDLDSLPPRSLQLLQRETTLMSLSKHPNVLRVRGSWMDGHKLYIALRLMKKGSAADVMHYGWPGGMEEDVVRCILRQALKGLNYLHINGFIHRDIKAANLLIDDDGTVLLGDLGVAADLTEDTSQSHVSSSKYSVTSTAALQANIGKRNVSFDGTTPIVPRPTIGKRKSFVGTPCWMSPELIQGKQYDSSADIWSFGITALELTQGRPPRSRESPQRVLLKTIQNDPPTLERDGGTFKYSRAFKEVVDSCLVKDPSKRPTADELLHTPFFKAAKNKSYLINTILSIDLPPLAQRQERRVVQPVVSTNSIDSWDFATTLHSPTTSVYRRRVLEDLVAAEDEELKASEVFHFEEDDDLNLSNLHTMSMSWIGDPEAPINEEVEPEPDLVLSSSPSTSESSAPSFNTSRSQISSPPDTSTPSSYTGSSDIAQRLHAAIANPIPASGLQEGLPIIAERSSDPTLVGLKTLLPPSTPNARSGDVLKSSSPASSIWSKLKNNVKRPSSSGGAAQEGSPRKDKERGRLNGMFSSGSKGLLSRGSSRSLSRQM